MNHYTYKITFTDGCYYYGRRSCECLPPDDVYYGSPKTHKEKWETTMFSKEIISTYASLEQSDIAEGELIGDSYKTDPLCLNEHNRGNFYNTGHTEEARAKMSATHKKIGTGRGPRSEETKKKISEGKRGKTFTEEHKAKLSAAHKGQCRPHTEETKAKIGEAHKGKKRSPEARAKMAEAARRRWSKQRDK